MEVVISVIGFGNIGKFISGLLIPFQGYEFKINVIDVNWKVYGAVLDFQHAAELFSNQEFTYNSEELLNKSDFIFHCAGASVPRGKSRLVTCQASIEITEAVFSKFKAEKEPFIIVVANPVDIISYITQKVTGLPKSKVIGTGTFLDAVRMNYAIKETNEGIKDVNAVLLGEHGTTTFISEQLSTVNGQPLHTVFDHDTLDELMNTVKASAEIIKETQEATVYGVSFCAFKIFEAILLNKAVQYPVSTFIPEYLNPELNNNNFYLSLCAELNENGAGAHPDYSPNERELEQLKTSASLIKPCIPDKYL